MIPLGRAAVQRSYWLKTAQVPLGRLRSVYATGHSGAGKTTWLGHLVKSCLDGGMSAIVFDVKRDLAHNLARRYPGPTVLLNPALALERGHPYALNPLADVGPAALMRLFVNIGSFEPSDMTTVDALFTWSLRLALADPASTFATAFRLLTDTALRASLLSKLDATSETAKQTRRYWTEELPALVRPSSWASYIDSTQKRMAAVLYGHESLAVALSASCTNLPLATWLDTPGQLVVVDLDRALLQEDPARKWANLLIGYLYSLALSRPAGEVAEPRWLVVVDEAHQLATLPFAEAMEQLRTHNVIPALAHQHAGQADGRFLKAMATAAVRVAFDERERYTAAVTYPGDKGAVTEKLTTADWWGTPHGDPRDHLFLPATIERYDPPPAVPPPPLSADAGPVEGPEVARQRRPGPRAPATARRRALWDE